MREEREAFEFCCTFSPKFRILEFRGDVRRTEGAFVFCLGIIYDVIASERWSSAKRIETK